MRSLRVLALPLLSAFLGGTLAGTAAAGEPPVIRIEKPLPIETPTALGSGSKLVPTKLWYQDSELFVYVREEEKIRQYYEENRKLEAAEADYHDKRRREDTARYQACFSWRLFKDGKLGNAVSKPTGFEEFDPEPFDLAKPFAHLDDQSLSRSRIGDSIILVPSVYEGGLWRIRPGFQPEILLRGYFQNPVASTDGRWVLVERRQEGSPNSLVLINMSTLRQQAIAPNSARSIPILYASHARRFLLCRSKLEAGWELSGDSECQYLLLNPETRAIAPAKGELRPLLETGKRFLQPAGKRDWYWAAIPEPAKNQTRVGRYNPRTLTFEAIAVVPHLVFGSMEMSVDPHEANAYVIHQEQLFRIPLPLHD